MEKKDLINGLRSSLEAALIENPTFEFAEGLNSGLRIALQSLKFWEVFSCK